MLTTDLSPIQTTTVVVSASQWLTVTLYASVYNTDPDNEHTATILFTIGSRTSGPTNLELQMGPHRERSSFLIQPFVDLPSGPIDIVIYAKADAPDVVEIREIVVTAK